MYSALVRAYGRLVQSGNKELSSIEPKSVRDQVKEYCIKELGMSFEE